MIFIRNYWKTVLQCKLVNLECKFGKCKGKFARVEEMASHCFYKEKDNSLLFKSMESH